MHLMIGPIQIILILIFSLLIPIGIFALGFFLGKKSGYKQSLKEIKNLQ